MEFFSILPACAGVIQKKTWEKTEPQNSSRMRGGDPVAKLGYDTLVKFFPHARG